MEYLNLCQVCRFCKKGSRVFKVHLSCFNDFTGEVNINPIERIHFSFTCQFCFHITQVDFETMCPPFCILHIKQTVREKKEKMDKLIQQLTSLVFEEK